MIDMCKEHLKSLSIKNETFNGLLSLLGYSYLNDCIEIGSYVYSEDSLISLFKNNLTA